MDNVQLVDSLDYIYKDVIENGMIPNGRWTIGSAEFMWMDSVIRHLIKNQNLFNTVLAHISAMYGSDIVIPGFIVDLTENSRALLTCSFLPIEEGENKGDWSIKIVAKDLSDEGEIIED